MRTCLRQDALYKCYLLLLLLFKSTLLLLLLIIEALQSCPTMRQQSNTGMTVEVLYIKNNQCTHVSDIIKEHIDPFKMAGFNILPTCASALWVGVFFHMILKVLMNELQ